jgi:putative ABC transport system permease protein
VPGVPALTVLFKRERSDFGGLALVLLLIAFTAFLAASALRLLERAADEGLQREVAGATVLQRTVQLTNTRPVFDQEATRPIADWQADGEQLRSMLPEAIGGVTGPANLGINSTRLTVTNPPDFPIYVNVRYQDNFEELAELTSGRWPAATGDALPPVVEFRTTGDGRPYLVGTEHILETPRRFEIALQEETSRELGLPIGYELSVNVDYTDLQLSTSILSRADVFLAPTTLVVTGLYRVRDQDSDGWFADPRLRIDDLGNTGVDLDPGPAYITAYVPPDVMPGLITSALPFEFRWRYPILSDRLDAEQVNETRRGLQLLEARPPSTDAMEEISAQVGLLPLLERHDQLLSASRAVLALAAGAPLALAGGAIAMAAVMLARRRRSTLVLARGRGASKRLLLATSLLEATAVSIAACLIGLGLALALEPSAELTPSLVAVAAIGAFAVAVLVGAALPQIGQPLGNLERGSRPAAGPNPRRVVAELTVVGIALVGAYVLRQRGLAATSAGFDPFLAAVPPLIGVAAVVGAVRLYPPVVAGAGWLARRRRDLVPILGIRAVARGAVSSTPALVLVLAIAFAAFASVVVASIDRAQQVASWIAVGADVRVEPSGSTPDLLAELDPSAISGIAASSNGYFESGIRAPAGAGAGTLALLALDTAAYANVVEGSPIEPDWPNRLIEQPSDGPLPAIVGSRLAGGGSALNTGDTFEMLVQGRRIQAEVVDVRPGIPGLTSADAFVVVPMAWLEHALESSVRPNLLWIRAPETTASALRDVSGGTAPGVEVVSRYEENVRLRNQPLLGAVGAGFLVAFVISVAYAVVTILFAVILSIGMRSRDMAILRTLGLHGRQQTRLTMIEYVPPILVALPMGILLGIAVASAVSPALGLGALSGSAGEVPLVIDWAALITLSIGLLLLALVAVGAGSWLARREAIINALRLTSD